MEAKDTVMTKEQIEEVMYLEIREAELAQEEYRTTWIEAEYKVAGWGIIKCELERWPDRMCYKMNEQVLREKTAKYLEAETKGGYLQNWEEVAPLMSKDQQEGYFLTLAKQILALIKENREIPS